MANETRPPEPFSVHLKCAFRDDVMGSNLDSDPLHNRNQISSMLMVISGQARAPSQKWLWAGTAKEALRTRKLKFHCWAVLLSITVVLSTTFCPRHCYERSYWDKMVSFQSIHWSGNKRGELLCGFDIGLLSRMHSALALTSPEFFRKLDSKSSLRHTLRKHFERKLIFIVDILFRMSFANDAA